MGEKEILKSHDPYGNISKCLQVNKDFYHPQTCLRVQKSLYMVFASNCNHSVIYEVHKPISFQSVVDQAVNP